ncbi:laminin G domain-containing protein [Actinoplanes sp. NPDC049265]|uniref:laminin G domain-containing protein n=1 Tax=Actinoplanes sp. NPDC049265 TaxID=3363902 RepID=UPI00371C43BD
MRIKHPTAVAVVTAALLTAFLPQPAGAAGGSLVAAWPMNEPAGARTMTDSTGHGHRGTVGHEVLTGTRISGATGYRFSRLEPDTPPPHPGHIVSVPDSSALDPGTRDYAVTLRFRTTGKFGNVVQKGQATVAGGNYKIQIPNGIVQCYYRGSAGAILISSPRKLNDGGWHTARCERTQKGVYLSIDGKLAASRGGWTGKIANSWPVTLGGKIDCDQIDVGCDYYNGDLDWVEISAG